VFFVPEFRTTSIVLLSWPCIRAGALPSFLLHGRSAAGISKSGRRSVPRSYLPLVLALSKYVSMVIESS
jgi:hypothetical protein